MAESDDLEAQLAKLQEVVTEASSTLEPIMEEINGLSEDEKKAYQEYLDHVNKIRANKIALDQKRFEAQRRLNEAKREADRLQREIELKKAAEQAAKDAEEAAKRAEEHNKAIAEKLEKATIGAPWREWAKQHQLDAGKFISQYRNVILADPMGLGKTLSSIVTVEMAQRATADASPEFPFLGEEKKVYDYQVGDYVTKIVGGIERPVGQRILYLCPASLIKNVRDEWKQWAPHRNVMFVGKMTKAEREFALEFAHENFNEYVVICNYEAWRRDTALLNMFVKMDFDTLIIDEAHNAKEMKTSIYKGIDHILTNKRPEYVIPMTGTPILNRPQELFTLLHMVNPFDFYNENDFLYTYCEQYENDQGTMLWKFKPGGLDRIAKRISKNFMRRTKDQAGIELPAKTIINHDIEVDTEAYPEQARARKEMRQYMTIVVDEKEGKALSAAAVIAMYTRLRQIETWPAGIVQRDPITKEIRLQLNVEESQKLDYVIKRSENGEWDGLIPEAISDERMVLFSQFKAPLREIQRRCEEAGIRAAVLDGDTSEALRDEIRKDFDARYTPERDQSKWDIVLCNYKVGGVGLNLTSATQLIVLDEEWNPGKRDQAYDRIHRIGQTKPVTIHLLRMQGTIDDWLASIMEAKEETVEGFNTKITSTQSLKDFLDGNDTGLI